jgi:hypothetical protein
MYDVNTGERIRVVEFGREGSIYYNSEGEIIYNGPAIQEAIEAGDWTGAVLLIFEGLQNMEGIDFEIIDWFIVDADGKQQFGVITIRMGYDIIQIMVYGPEYSALTKVTHPEYGNSLGSTLPTDEECNEQYVKIFFEKPCMDAATLFHVVAHEMQHVIHFVEGDFHIWKREWNEEAALAYSDYLAYKWNVEHLYITGPILVNVWGKMQEYLEMWYRYKRPGMI